MQCYIQKKDYEGLECLSLSLGDVTFFWGQEVMAKESRQGNGPVGVRTFKAEELGRQWPVAGTQRAKEELVRCWAEDLAEWVP